MKCAKCGYEPKNESELDLHHKLPKFLGGTDRTGRAYLCGAGKGNDCHRKLHKFLGDIILQLTEKWLLKEED